MDSDGESNLDVLLRAYQLLQEINRLYIGKTVILFSHGMLITLLRALFFDQSLIDETGQFNWSLDFTPNAKPLLLAEKKTALTAEEAVSSVMWTIDEIFARYEEGLDEYEESNLDTEAIRSSRSAKLRIEIGKLRALMEDESAESFVKALRESKGGGVKKLSSSQQVVVDVAEKLSDKLQNKEPITPDEIKLYEFVSEQLSKGELQNVIDKAGLRKLTKAEEAKPTEAAKPFTEVKGLIPFTELADISKKEKAGTELTAEEVKLKETYPDEYKAETERKSKGVPSEPAADKNYNIAQEVNKKIAEEHPSVSVLITPKGEDLSMTGLFVKETERGKGAGSKVLETVKSEADRTGKKVTLTATDEFGGDIKRLNEFYERNGFTKVGENKFEYNPKQPTPKPTEAPKAEVKPAEVTPKPVPMPIDFNKIQEKAKSGDLIIDKKGIAPGKKGNVKFILFIT